MDEILLRQRLERPLRKKIPFSQQTNKTITALVITLASIIVILSSMFLFATGSTAQKGYLLKQSQLKNDELKNEQDDLERKVIDASSFEKLEKNEAIKKMEEPTEKMFVQRGTK